MYLSTQEDVEAPKSVPVKLPPNWRTAKDSEGNIYYYHIKTRQTQWDPPDFEENMDVDTTPTHDELKVNLFYSIINYQS